MPIYQCGESNPCGWQVELSEDNAELKQHITGLEQHIENYRIACEGFEHGARVAADRIAQLEADNAALRAALHEVEWDAHCHCPWCGVQMGKRHRPTCQRQSALGLNVKG